MKKVLVCVMLSLTTIFFIGCSEKKEEQKDKIDSEINQREESLRDDYITKYYDLEKKLERDLEKLYNGNTIELKEASEIEYKAFDDLLNEVYKKIEDNTTKEEFAEIKKEQIEWIKMRDIRAEGEGEKWEGGTFQPIAIISSRKESTKVRTLILITKYLK